MSFLGKEYKSVNKENYAGFLKSFDLTDERVQAYLNTELKEKLVKNGDSYTLYYNSPFDNREVTFKPGVEIEEIVEDGIVVKSTYKIDGNSIHQVAKTPDNIANFKKEFNGNDLVVTMTSDKWDGVARVYYKA